MDIDASTPRSRPLLLLGCRGEARAALAGCPLLRSCVQVTAPADLDVAPLVGLLRPTAVLLDSAEFHLDGRRIHGALRRSSPETRVLFLDLDGPWALWIELESEETRDLRVVPCETARSGDALLELIQEEETTARRLASAG